jgi:hypothetical protein
MEGNNNMQENKYNTIEASNTNRNEDINEVRQNAPNKNSSMTTMASRHNLSGDTKFDSSKRRMSSNSSSNSLHDDEEEFNVKRCRSLIDVRQVLESNDFQSIST